MLLLGTHWHAESPIAMTCKKIYNCFKLNKKQNGQGVGANRLKKDKRYQPAKPS
jgi:hypothetical protein